ncbi:2',3'-cyclic-nucleotide 2'-phosphodiesterase [soil metagenome]
MSTYRILFLGDVVGRPGREAVKRGLPFLQHKHTPLFTIVNGENASHGVGIQPENADEFFKAGADAITLGNHAFRKRDILPYLDSGKAIVRPANMPPAPGRGLVFIEREDIRLAVMNLCGRVEMEAFDDPFRELDRLLTVVDTPHVFLDFHAEATSEKVAMGWYADGKVSAVVGTHTHVQTADERILPLGTAYITDVGMSGPSEGVLGMDRTIILNRFTTALSQKFEVAQGPSVICGVVIDVERLSGKAVGIERIRFGEE